MVHVSSNVRENDIFVICIKRHNLSLYFFFRKNAVLFTRSHIQQQQKWRKKKHFLNNMVTNQDIAYQDSIAFFLRLDIFVPIIS